MKGLQRPIWAIGYYMLNFFAQPQYWHWGAPLYGGIRWSLIAAWIMLGAVLMFGSERQFRPDQDQKRVSLFAVLLVINGLFVQLVFAYNPRESWLVFIEMAKFVVLYFVILQAIQSRKDFILLLWFLALGIGYWGFEARFIGGLQMVDGRLEKFGGPGCNRSNELASILASLTPVIIGLVFLVKGRNRIFAIACVLLGLNVLLLAQSRGGFLAIIVSGIVIPLVASGRARKLALRGVAMGGLAVVLLAGNPEILVRFMTTFTDTTQSDPIAQRSKESRKFFWNLGLQIVQDHPFGNGGDAFEFDRGSAYIIASKTPYLNKSVHQGFINEAIDWGIQGLLIHLGLIFSAIWYALIAMRFRMRLGDLPTSFFGSCLIGGFAAFFIGSLFGDFVHLEWGYWLCIIAVCYAKIFGQTNYGLLPDTKVSREEAAEGDPALYRELSATGF